jgi:hypothetical protein
VDLRRVLVAAASMLRTFYFVVFCVVSLDDSRVGPMSTLRKEYLSDLLALASASFSGGKTRLVSSLTAD